MTADYSNYREPEKLRKHLRGYGKLILFQAQLVAWRKSQRDTLLQGGAILIYDNEKALSQLIPSLLRLFSTLLSR